MSDTKKPTATGGTDDNPFRVTREGDHVTIGRVPMRRLPIGDAITLAAHVMSHLSDDEWDAVCNVAQSLAERRTRSDDDTPTPPDGTTTGSRPEV